MAHQGRMGQWTKRWTMEGLPVLYSRTEHGHVPDRLYYVMGANARRRVETWSGGYAASCDLMDAS